MMHDTETLLAAGYKAFTYSDGTVMTFNSNDIIDSFNDQPSRIAPEGSLYWHKNGVLHRVNGPAAIQVVEGRTTTAWRQNGTLHRTDGPAIYRDCQGPCEWWVRGIPYDNAKAYQQAAELSDEQMIKLILQYGDIS